ncbi:MAG TPA: hypothetical protein VKO18_05750, partial [Terriglobia bacterium]|nr:hypothetical protein [Terriglobia bacterium]
LCHDTGFAAMEGGQYGSSIGTRSTNRLLRDHSYLSWLTGPTPHLLEPDLGTTPPVHIYE